MGYKPNHAKPSAGARAAARGAALAGAAAIAAAGAAAITPTAASAATTPLPVTFAHDGNGSAGWANGDIVLQLGTDSGSTFAQVSVDLNALGNNRAPQDAPSFTTDNFGGASSPRWLIELANGNFLVGYPAQAADTGATGANGTFTGPQWQANSGNGSSLNSGGVTYETYSQALKDAGDILGNVQVTDAGIVADADQTLGSKDTLTNVQYDGDSPVAPTPPPVVPQLSNGHHTLLNNNRVTIAWTSTPDNAKNGYEVTIHTPGVENDRTAIVHTDQAVYSGLEAGHTGWVNIQPLQANGQPYSGDAGHVYFTTTHK